MIDSSLSVSISAGIVALITMGAAVMSLAIFKTRRIIGQLRRSDQETDQTHHQSAQSQRSWQYLSGLMTFFLGGYCLAAYLTASQNFIWLPLLTGTVFFFGALFVLFSVSVYTQTFHKLLAVQRSYRDERDRTTSTLEKLQKTQMLLVHNEKMLSLGQLSAGIAHEINNPVSFIHGNLSHLQNYTDDLFALIELYEDADQGGQAVIATLKEEIDFAFLKEDIYKTLSSMKIGTQRIRQIVTSMRTFSRLDESRHKQADLIEGIESALVMLKSRLTDTTRCPEISVVKDYAALPMICCDHGAVNQVFLHLLNNAIDAIAASSDHTSAESPKISISTCLNHDWVQVTISDNGVGIDEKTLCQIFDPFFTTKPVGKGTGLGLSTSHQIIVEQHGGRLLCDSELGKGTAFKIELPVSVSGDKR